MAYSLARNEPIRAAMLYLKDVLGVTTFVETGTRQGSGVTWASLNGFYPAYTIDILDRHPQGQFLTLIQDDRIYRHIGNSPDVLKDLLPWVDEPTIFWLDGHGPRDVGSPVLEELELILARSEPSYIFIDDISIFARERFYDMRYSSWPWARQLYEALGKRPRFERADALVSFPEGGSADMAFCRKVAHSVSWGLEEPPVLTKEKDEGWYRPLGSGGVQHYFMRGVSVCGKLQHPGSTESRTWGKRGTLRCMDCLDRL